MARQWILNSQKGFKVSLEYQENVAVRKYDSLKPNEVLVKLHAASLNYRELTIAAPNSRTGPIKPPVIPGCDGAGTVEAVGSSVTSFRTGDRVVTHLAPRLFESRGNNALAGFTDTFAMLGIGTDGTLRSHGTFAEGALVHAPKSLDWLPAATLTCTWLTAWNALFGLEGRKAGPGSWVLAQGTGGVSIAVLQLAVAVGATVVATTSADDRAARLRDLGAAHTVNYRTLPTWGAEGRSLTPDGRGFDIVVDVGGDATLPQSLAAIRNDGVLYLIGGVGGTADPVPMIMALVHTCIVRGTLGGSRAQFAELVQFIDEKGIKPAVDDDIVFELAEAKEAYRRVSEKKHFSKVQIRIDHNY
ncbi:putative alcohol dehydrogenase [Xylariaceae sp. FL0255]|nr:putative alcohol dehydrogenase [Xylariaceae sp. FL0255]